MEKRLSTVYEAITTVGYPEDIALEAPGKKPMTYECLRLRVRHTVDALHAMGYGPGDRIAVVAPNGPEMAVAFLAVASAFTCVPLNPAYREKELETYLCETGAAAVIVPQEPGTPAMTIAWSTGLPIITMAPESDRAGAFTLAGEKIRECRGRAYARPGDVGMVLHTSGTTSRPKLVPLSQSGMVSAALNMALPLALTQADRCLNISPLYYVGGLLGSLLGTIATGGSVVCTPGFLPERFFEWVRSFRPSWYTSVPAIHQKILELAAEQPAMARSSSFRLIRSSAAALPSPVIKGLEDLFDIPVIEAYGMTEAPHQIATNPLPPLPRKIGSVGRGVGVEIAVVNDGGDYLPPGTTGQIVIKGPGVFSGYENDPDANARAFIRGWFCTGDLGHLDEDGYLYIDGRIREVINRGGEMLSPGEIEEALLAHPGVSEAAAFAIPDPALGENVGAAVVLKEGADTDATALKKHVSGRLAYFKVPAKLWIVTALPRGPTGKVQRIGMFDRLGPVTAPEAPAHGYEPPATATEKTVAALWAEVLDRERIGRLDSFFDLGGDSLLATMVLSRVSETFGVKVPIARMMDCDTVARLGQVLDQAASPHADPRPGDHPQENPV